MKRHRQEIPLVGLRLRASAMGMGRTAATPVSGPRSSFSSAAKAAVSVLMPLLPPLLPAIVIAKLGQPTTHSPKPERSVRLTLTI